MTPASDGPVPSEADGEDILTLLRCGELELIGQVRSASNATLLCDAVLDERRLRCVYKPVRGEQPLWDFPDGTLAGREVASYRISAALGWPVIPETVLRDGRFGPGMVQRWIDTPDTEVAAPGRLDLVDLCPSELIPADYLRILDAFDARGEEVTLVHADDPRLLRMAVLDVVINNADRKGGHVLEGLDGNVYGVDHGICLHVEDKLRTVLWGWSGEVVPAHLVADVVGLCDALATDSSDLVTELVELITPAEVAALRERAEFLVEVPEMPSAARSRPIPWPAF